MASHMVCFWRPAFVSALVVFSSASQALTPSQVFEAVKDSVVVVKTLDAKGKGTGFGSGVLLPDGRVATNCHVIQGGVSFMVGRDKRFVPATLYAGDDDKDICLLDAKDIGGRPVTLGKAAALKVGESVYAVGAPQGLELSLSDGIVSQLRGGQPPFIQTTAAISPGSSGGGLFDTQARLIGLTTLYIGEGQNLNFAMPVDWLAGIKPGIKNPVNSRSQVDWLTHAIALEEKRDWQGLLAWAKQWTTAEPGRAGAWFSAGTAYWKLNQLGQAIGAYNEALRVTPEYVSAGYNLGVIYMDLNRTDEAITSYREVLRINPEHVESWNNLGLIYHSLKRYDDAITAYRQALRINQDQAETWNNLGNTSAKLKRYDDAINAYRQALRINPEVAAAWFNLGSTYIDIKDYHTAIAVLPRALRIESEHVPAMINLGIAFKNLKRYDDAIFNYREALRIAPENVDVWFNLAVAYSLSGNTTAALQAVKALRPLDPSNADKLFDLIVPR